MKIATWNLERPKPSSGKNNTIIDELEKVDADILILTETSSSIRPHGYSYACPSDVITKGGENRTTIWSKYPLGHRIPTYDSATAVCVNVETSNGELNVYGTVIGVVGNREKSFLPDLEKQIADWERISQLGDFCVAGDFNISWDSYYFTKAGREKISAAFKALEITNLTRNVAENIDHIAISASFLKTASQDAKTEIWNPEKGVRNLRLSDHLGVSVTLAFQDSKD